MKFSDIFTKLKSVKGLGFIILLLAAGLILIISSGGNGKSASAKESESEGFDFGAYESALEKRLEGKIDKIRGVADPDVILLADTSYTYDYKYEGSGGVLSGGYQSGKYSAPSGESAPKIRGVAVICSGGDDPVLQKQITDMLSALLGLPANKIWVGGK